ncbi:MAG TPA: agmatine deiminase family protein [Patescibacteria group bacterium]|nr:agmatine deiminase family protein [Patescibacteria group bacterium]
MAATPSPSEMGYRIVPDARAAGRYWLAWPRPGEVEAQQAVLILAELLCEWAPVTLLANPAELAELSLRAPTGVTTMLVPHDGARLKPCAPLFLRRPDDGSVAALLPVSAVARGLADHLNCPIFVAPPWFHPHLVEADGSGVLLASRTLLQAGERDEIERGLQRLTSSEHIVWLDAGLAGGDGAVTAVARCLAPGVALAMAEGDVGDENAAILRDTAAQLRDAHFTVFSVPQPARQPRRSGWRLPASYTSCLVNEQAIILPAFEDARDDMAAADLAAAFPTRKIISEPAGDLLRAGYDLASLVAMQPPMPGR